MAKRTLECHGKCGNTLEVFAENITAFICRSCNSTAPPRGSLLCSTCLVRAVKVNENVKEVMCSHCTQTALTQYKQEDRLDRSEITGEMIRAAMKKEGWKTYKVAAAHLQKIDKTMSAARLGQNVRGNISPPERVLVDWVRETLTGSEMDKLDAPDTQTPPKAVKPSVGHDDAEAEIVKWLQSNEGWHSRSDITDSLRMTTSVWNQAIKELVSSGKVNRKGKKRGTRYSI